MSKFNVEIEIYSKIRCDNVAYDNLAIKCIKEKNHLGKHSFYLEWNDFT